jgi:hypothetical protein
MPLPEINYCMICEGVRSEERHKATILGFFNVLPWVEIKLAEFGAGIVPLMFFFGTSGGTGKANFQATLTNAEGTIVAKTPEVPVTFPEGSKQVNIGLGIENLMFHAAGKYTLRLRVSGQQKYESTFTVGHDPSLKP